MNIAVIFDTLRPDTIGIYFEKALRAIGHNVDHFQSHEIPNITKRYHLYLCIDDGLNRDELPRRLFPKVFYAIDVHLAGPESKMRKKILKRNYDLVFSPAQWWIDKMKRVSPVELIWMNHGCDPEIHKRLDLERIYDIGFVGTDGGVPRKFYLQEIRERYPNSFIGTADYREMGRIYSSSKIGFSFPIRSEYLTLRNYEIMASGAMLLMKRLRDDCAERLGFIDRKNIVIFDGPEDLFEKIDYYLKNHKEREEIAEAGYRLTVEKHTYLHRAKEMIDIISDRFDIKN
jgi:glycosyltransferase involved in cell wall biosynthesis